MDEGVAPRSISDVFTLSHAKTYLGRLIDKAGRGEAVYIARGQNRFLLQPVRPIDPIPIRPPKATEETLDEADGLDWKTMVRCDRIYLLPKAQFAERKGSVTEERRHLVDGKIVEVLRLPIHRR